MKEHGIIMQGWGVRAILEGHKTQTRRVIRPQPWQETATGPTKWYPNKNSLKAKHYASERHLRKGFPLDFCPYGQPGDLLYVRETWGVPTGPARPIYRADYDNRRAPLADGEKWRSGRFMHKQFARLWLQITGVRMERVQEISEEDAKAEGCEIGHGLDDTSPFFARDSFEKLWDSINSKRGFSWKVNPWVWVIEFERIRDSQHV